MPNFSTTLTTAVSSAPGASAIAEMSWLGGRPATASVTVPSVASTSASFVVQYTLDDVMRVASTTVLWLGVSSAQGQAGTVWNATSIGQDGVLVSFLSPVAAVRVNSTQLTGGPITLKVLQGEP